MMRMAYEELGKTGNKATRRKSRDMSSMSTPLSANGDEKSTSSRGRSGSEVIKIKMGEDHDITRMKENSVRENTLKGAIKNFERDTVKFKIQIEQAQAALDEYYMEMISGYGPVNKLTRFE